MKVYVDELPKSCHECPHCYHEDRSIYCCVIRNDLMEFFGDDYFKRANECPLQSLADYTKQVRKEVCDEIRKNAISHNNLEVDMYYITPQQLYEIEQGETK